MKKKLLFYSIILFCFFIFGFYLLKFQRPFLGLCKDYVISTYIHFKVKNSNSYKQFTKTDKTMKYYKSEKNINIPILLYHEISANTPTRDKFDLCTSKKQFEYQISELSKLGYTFITYDDLIAYNNNQLALPEYIAIINFDDGYKGVYENAFPIIKKYNVPINIFIIDSCIDSENYFSWDNAKEMDNSGLVHIYTHGKDHIHYGYESNEKTVLDITTAHSHIENELGHPVTKVFAYPYGNYNDSTILSLTNAGFIQNLLLEQLNTSENLNLSKLTRIYVKNNYNVYQILNLIQ